jgi:hypothetical protein
MKCEGSRALLSMLLRLEGSGRGVSEVSLLCIPLDRLTNKQPSWDNNLSLSRFGLGISRIIKILRKCHNLLTLYLLILYLTMLQVAVYDVIRYDVDCRSQWRCCLRLECWGRGFESHSKNGCPCVFILFVLSYDLTKGWSPIQGVLWTVYRNWKKEATL